MCIMLEVKHPTFRWTLSEDTRFDVHFSGMAARYDDFCLAKRCYCTTWISFLLGKHCRSIFLLSSGIALLLNLILCVKIFDIIQP